MAATGKILIIVTNTDQYKKVGLRTGLWLGELVHFWDIAEKAGYQMDIVSPEGGKVPIDPESLIVSEVANTVGIGSDVSKRYEDREFMDLLDRTRNVSDANVRDYDAMYLTGGHGVMFDYPTSVSLAELTGLFYDANKIVSAVCHGPAGLLEVRLKKGGYLIANREVTGFSWKEEQLARRDHAVPFNLEEELQRRGAQFSKAWMPFTPHVVVSGRLITGQNPASAADVARAVVEALQTLNPISVRVEPIPDMPIPTVPHPSVT
ncbi:protease I [Nitrospira sp. KM1]|uniref:type 1 glutamine amidotransferase domain-containing protein n=1 Tax=Nitrospira sp. KM1 TaxID=1936990 RepID=UPI0013A70E7C|nr:type 1 glutamine amidotransferase domain-containing protein [Nitrospira sp. KM1]BCA55082.1 protease I [Nitrospira sp. KM1]